MPIKASGIEVTALKLGGVNVARAKYNGIEVFTAFRPPSPITFSITAGFGSGLIGYWGARGAGSISDASIVTLDGEAATVTQLAFGPSLGTNELRFSIRQAGLGVGDADQFPVEIRIARGSNVGTFVPKATEDIRATSDGVSRDYVPVSGGVAPSSVIQFGQRSRVTISWTRDTTPDFGTATIAAQSWMQNTAITDLVLPAATGGNAPLIYSLSPALPAGLTFTAATRTISGTPSAAAAEATYTYTVTDADGDTDTIEFAITVAAAVAPITATLTLASSRYGQPNANLKRWQYAFGTGPIVPSAFLENPSVSLRIDSVNFLSNGSVIIDVNPQAGQVPNDGLISAWETGGTTRLRASGIDIMLSPADPPDTSEPYTWPPGTISSAQFRAIASSFLSVTLTVPASTMDLSSAATFAASQYNAQANQRAWLNGSFVTTPVAEELRAVPASQVFITSIALTDRGHISLDLSSRNSMSSELSDNWKNRGRMRVQTGSLDIDVAAPSDRVDPYIWPPDTWDRSLYSTLRSQPITVTLTAPSIRGAYPSITVGAATYESFTHQGRLWKRWQYTGNNGPLVPLALRTTTTTRIRGVAFIGDRSAILNLDNGDLVSPWESGGRVRFQAGTVDIDLAAPTPLDQSEPYEWPSGAISQDDFSAINGGELTITFSIP